MKQRKPVIHARDHLPGGADPIPGVLGTTAPPVNDPIQQAGDRATAAGQEWHWWRFRKFGGTGGHGIADEGSAAAPDFSGGYPMQVTAYHPLDFNTEFDIGLPGPTSDSLSMERTGDFWPGGTVPGRKNWWSAVSVHAGNEGVGTKWSYAGWFKFTVLGHCDVYNDGYEAHPTTVFINGDGSVSIRRWGVTAASRPGLIRAGAWHYIAYSLGNGRLRVYVDPATAEAGDYAPTYGTSFPFAGPLAMETFGLEKGDYTAAALAAKLNANGFKSIAVQLNAAPGPGRTHADYITKLAADVDTLQAAGITVVGWGEVDSNTGADLAATGVTGWMPQIEGPSQYDNVIAALGAGVGAGMPKAVVTTYGGLDTAAKVTALKAAGIESAMVETYAAEGAYPYSDVDVMLNQGVIYGFDRTKLTPILGTYRGETPADYTGFDEDVIPNYGIFSIPQTSDAAWDAFAQQNKGSVMMVAPVIDIADPATGPATGPSSIGGPNTPSEAYGADGAFTGFVTEVVHYYYTLAGSTHQAAYQAGKYGDTGTVPPTDQIPTGSVAPASLRPGAEGQTLVTRDGFAIWEDALDELDELADVDTSGVTDGAVLTYDAGAAKWVPAAGGGVRQLTASWTGTTPDELGAGATWRVPTVDGGTVITFDLGYAFARIEDTDATDTEVVIEASSGGAFAPLVTLTIAAGDNEATGSAAPATVSSGDLLRIVWAALAADLGTLYTVQLEGVEA